MRLLMIVRGFVGISLLLLAGVFSEVQLNNPTRNIVRNLTGFYETGPDRRQSYLTRVKELREELPRRGVVGYVTDESPGYERYIFAQHVLAPLLLEYGASYPIVVGSFVDPSAAVGIAQQENLRLIKDFGDGVTLFTSHATR